MKKYMVEMCMVLMCMVLIGMISQGALAQNYPVRPIQLVVHSVAGSNADINARLIAEALTKAFGQQVVVVNRAGGGGNIAAEIAARSPADGYTIFQVAQAQAVNVSLYHNLAYDLMRDFAAVTRLSSVPQVVVVHPSFPVKSISDLVTLVKAKPGVINYAHSGAGTSTFLAGELFKMMAGVNMVPVPYKGGSQAMTSVVSGETSVYFPPLAAALSFIQQGRVRLLAVTSAKRLSGLLEYPTVAESGYPGYDCASWYGLMVPVKTPNETIATIRRAVIAVLKQPDVSKRFHDLGFTTFIGDQPEEFAEYIKSEIVKWREIVQKTGMTTN